MFSQLWSHCLRIVHAIVPARLFWTGVGLQDVARMPIGRVSAVAALIAEIYRYNLGFRPL
jgi:hypothetical protein